MAEADTTLFHTREYQIKVLSYMLVNQDFKTLAAESVKSEMFSDKALQWFFESIGKAPIALSKNTLKEELIKAASKKLIKKDDVKGYVELYNDIIVPPLPDEVTHITNNVCKFVKTQNVKRAIMQSFDLAREGKWDEIEGLIAKAITSGEDVLSLGYNYFQEFETRVKKRANQEDAKKICTGIPELDDVTYGGLGTKQVALIVGGTGRGKSLLLQWLARVAIMMGEQVVYYTLELPADMVATRFDSMMAKIKPHELKTKYQESLDKLSVFAKKYGSSLIIKEYLPKEVSVKGIESHFKTLCASTDIRPKLVLIDYLDLLKPVRNINDPLAEMDETVQHMCSFAKSFDIAIWTATQLNRSGLVAESPDESAVSGSITKLFNVDLAIFLAQTREERELEEMRIIVSKSRLGQAGMSIGLETNFAIQTFFRHKEAADDGIESTETREN